jgi:hypothetical protein
MRHVYDFHGYPISEDMLLGLGAGVGFIYWHMKGLPPFLGGRANTGRPGEEGLENTAGRRTGVTVECLQTSSTTKADQLLWAAFRKGPVMIRVDMGYLPYLGLPRNYHFGGHVVVVAGYDQETRQVLLADRDEELHPITRDDLVQARGSIFKPFPPRNTLFTFDFSSKRRPSKENVRQAIHETVKGMLQPPITNLGVKGIHKAAACVAKWPKTMNGDELRHACFNAFVFIDSTGGTGGGIFRYMYGRFLKEAAAITGQRRLEAIGDQMQMIGDVWQQVALLFKGSSSPNGSARELSEASALLTDIAEREEDAWMQLHAVI